MRRCGRSYCPGDRLAGVLPESVERTEGDICSASALENFFAGTDESTCVIHTAGIVTVASRPDASLYRVNVDGTRAILRECAAHGVGKLVYISSVHALPEKPKGMTITETDAVSSEFVSGDYAKSKAEATSLVFAAAKNGLNASIVFPVRHYRAGRYRRRQHDDDVPLVPCGAAPARGARRIRLR